MAFTVLQKRVLLNDIKKLSKDNRYKNMDFYIELKNALVKDFEFNENQALVIIKATYTYVCADPQLMSYSNSDLDLANTINLVDNLKTK